MLFLHLFYTFFKIGLFGFGGGYAMLSMIQGEVVTRYGWLTPQEFTDIVAISQMTPGSYRHQFGNLCRLFHDSRTIRHEHGSAWVLCSHFRRSAAFVHPDAHHQQILSEISEAPAVEAVFSGLRPAVVGLLASAALVLMNTENFSSPQEDIYSFIISIIIFLAAFIGTRKYKVNPILMIIVCGIAGLILY